MWMLFISTRNYISGKEKKYLYIMKVRETSISTIILPERYHPLLPPPGRKENLWMGTTSNGLYCLSGDKKISQPVTRGNIASIYEDSSKELWICTWEEGLYRIKTDSTIENFRHDPKNPNSICADFVRSCCEDNAGNLWIGTFHGLNRYEKAQVNSNFTLPTRTNPTDSPTPPSGASSKMNKEQFGWVLISEVSTISIRNMKSIHATRQEIQKKKV